MDEIFSKFPQALLSGLFTVMGALVAFLAVALTVFFTSRNNNKNIFIQTVTSERAKWRQFLREETAEFCKIAYRLVKNSSIERSENSGSISDDIDRLEELRVLIRLKMNPKPERELDSEIMQLTQAVIRELESDNLTSVQGLTQKLEDLVQRLLKQEWEKSKQEARKGKLVRTEKASQGTNPVRVGGLEG